MASDGRGELSSFFPNCAGRPEPDSATESVRSGGGMSPCFSHSVAGVLWQEMIIFPSRTQCSPITTSSSSPHTKSSRFSFLFLSCRRDRYCSRPSFAWSVLIARVVHCSAHPVCLYRRTLPMTPLPSDMGSKLTKIIPLVETPRIHLITLDTTAQRIVFVS